MGKDVIVACDFDGEDKLFGFLTLFGGKRPYIKVGMEMFYAYGPDLVKRLKDDGYKIFLDLKLNDIPNTVNKAMKSLSRLEIDMVNLHALGGCEMMRAAAEAFSCSVNRPKVIAVTLLTSLTEEALKKELLIEGGLDAAVRQYSNNAKLCALDGVVCSPLEASLVHEQCGSDFLTVTPGVRYAENDSADQKRTMSPAEAKMNTADYIVVGRPITQSDEPLMAYEKFCSDFIG